jgi:hypothetical protein
LADVICQPAPAVTLEGKRVQIDVPGNDREQMMKRSACMIAALTAFSLNGALGQVPVDTSLQGKDMGRVGDPHSADAKNAEPRQPPPGGNPLWGIPIDSLSATRERPIFSASRRPPAPPAPIMPIAEPPPSPPAPEKPPFTLAGTTIGKPQNVALIVDQSTKRVILLHVGEAASGWYLRSVDSRTMKLEKNSQFVTLSLPPPGAVPAEGQPAVTVAARVSHEF